MRFTWDPDKAASNIVDHEGVTFEEATEVFADGVHTLEKYDGAHDEPRWQTLGPSSRGLLMVVWTERDGDTIRIISARPATRNERAQYRASIGGKHE